MERGGRFFKERAKLTFFSNSSSLSHARGFVSFSLSFCPQHTQRSSRHVCSGVCASPFCLSTDEEEEEGEKKRPSSMGGHDLDQPSQSTTPSVVPLLSRITFLPSLRSARPDRGIHYRPETHSVLEFSNNLERNRRRKPPRRSPRSLSAKKPPPMPLLLPLLPPLLLLPLLLTQPPPPPPARRSRARRSPRRRRRRSRRREVREKTAGRRLG